MANHFPSQGCWVCLFSHTSTAFQPLFLPASLRETIGRSYYEARGRYPDEFWRLRAGGGGARELADETKFMQIGVEQPELMVQAMAAHNNLTDCLMRDGSDDEGSEKAIGEIVSTCIFCF